jgi:hypothetical protein
MKTEQLHLPLGLRRLVECGAGLNHHLRQKPSGLWQVRITVDRGPKYVGRRVVIGLGTRDVREARVRRDLILKSLRVAERVRG